MNALFAVLWRRCVTLLFNVVGVEPLRRAAGAGTNTRDNPVSIETFVPSEDRGGLLDRKAAKPKAITAGK